VGTTDYGFIWNGEVLVERVCCNTSKRGPKFHILKISAYGKTYELIMRPRSIKLERQPPPRDERD
jgi:hypothetical protein